MYLNVKYRSMYTLDILSKTLSFTLPTSSQVTLRLGVDVFYTGSGTSFSIPLPLKSGQVQEGAYVLNINGTETILSYKFPREVPDIVWDVNGLLSTLSVSDNKTYTGTIISQSIECMPPTPLVDKTGLNKANYTPNIYSGDWSIIRKIKLSYDAGNGLNVINTIENTYTEIVLNINAKNLYQAVTNYIKSFVENCSPQGEIAKFTKVNAYLQQYENYIELVDYENAYNSLVKAGELVGVDKTIQEIIPFTINENGGGCCDKEVVPAHTAYFGFSEVALMTDSIAKTLSIEKYNIYAHRDWHMSQDGITSRFAYIIVPTSVAALIAMVKIKGGLLAVWESQLITIDGVPYKAIKSPNKFFDKDATFVTDALDDCDIALQWVNSNGSNVLTHIGDGGLHLKQGDRTKLDNLSGINTGDQDLSGLEPKKGTDEFYITGEEKFIGALLTGNTTLTTLNQVANKARLAPNENGTILYHTAKWFTPTGTISTNGTTATSTSAQFTSVMVGAKLIIMGEERIIATYINSTTVIVVSAYTQNYAGIISANWGVFNKSVEVAGGRTNMYSSSGKTTMLVGINFDINGILFNTSGRWLIDDDGVSMHSANKIAWSASAGAGGVKDIGLKRSSAGVLEVFDGITAGSYRDLNVRNINYYGALTNASDGHLKENTREVTNGLQKALKLAKCVRHFTFKNQDAYAKGQRTGFMAQLLRTNGFEGHVSERAPRNEGEGVDFGWVYKDECFEDTNPETGEVETCTKRVVDKEGTPILQIDTNFTPYLFKAIEDLNDKVEKLEARLLKLEDNLIK